MLNIIFLSAAVAAISFTVTMSSIFRSFRLWVDDMNETLGDLVSCPYCFSHWVALAMSLVHYSKLPELSEYFAVNLIVNSFVMVTVSYAMCGVLLWAKEKGKV